MDELFKFFCICEMAEWTHLTQNNDSESPMVALLPFFMRTRPVWHSVERGPTLAVSGRNPFQLVGKNG